MLEASLKDQLAGGQGLDTRITCMTNGMPRIMTFIRPVEFIVLPTVTYIHYENIMPRRIYTDGRDWPQNDEPTFVGYSIGKWIDQDGDGRYDLLEVETRNFKGPRTLEASGLPLHADNQTIVKERIYLDKTNKDVMRNEITVIDHAFTGPWTVVKTYLRVPNDQWYEDNCSENNNHIIIGKEIYFLSGDGYSPERPGAARSALFQADAEVTTASGEHAAARPVSRGSRDAPPLSINRHDECCSACAFSQQRNANLGQSICPCAHLGAQAVSIFF
jgi:hypothetical protein